MGGRAGGGARGGGLTAGQRTALKWLKEDGFTSQQLAKAKNEMISKNLTGQIKTAQGQYQKAKAAYDAASKAINSPTYGYGKGWEKTQAKFQKASDRYEKSKAKLTKLKNAKKIADYNAKNP